MNNSLWNEASEAMLRDLCARKAEKLSAPTIARMMTEDLGPDRPFTRASIVGKCNRLGISLPITRPPAKNHVYHAKPTPQHTAVLFRRIVIEPPQLPKNRVELIAEPAGMPGIFLINAAARDCRAPISGSGMYLRVCSEETQPGSAYCPKCHGKMWLEI